MIEISRQAIPYLSGITLLGSICSYSTLKAINEFCGFYHDELTEENQKEYINYSRLTQGIAWTIFSAFSGFGCYLLCKEFSETKAPKIDLEMLSKHEQDFNHLAIFYSERYREKNNLRNLCWNYLESSEVLLALKRGEGLGTPFESTIKYAYESFHSVERETDELRRQNQALLDQFILDTAPLRENITNYEVAKGVRVNFEQLCQTPYGWLNTTLCHTQKSINVQKKKYSLLEAEIEDYKREVFAFRKINRCKEAYSIQGDFDTLYRFGEIKVEKENEEWWSWIKSFFSF